MPLVNRNNRLMYACGLFDVTDKLPHRLLASSKAHLKVHRGKHSKCEQGSFLSSFPTRQMPVNLSWLTVLTRTPNTGQNERRRSRHPLLTCYYSYDYRFLFYFTCMNILPACMHTCAPCACLLSPELNPGNRTWVLFKNSQCS